jgi:enamine deaminase RidA (YjgF/YER057c/UK114 family)
MFGLVRDIVEAAGGTTDDIITTNVWLKDPSDRSALNTERTAMFSDAMSRPALHVFTLEGESIVIIQCDFMTVFDG